ncbi:3714_t:CDS:2, partial [Paraglomus occultum]
VLCKILDNFDDVECGKSYIIHKKDEQANQDPDEKVEKILMSLDKVADHLCSPNYFPLQRSKQMGIPLAGGRPILLVHNLPERGKEGLTNSKKLMQNQEWLNTILGASGSGKTRLCFELLCQQYGFYLVTEPTPSLGSKDVFSFTRFCESVFRNDNLNGNPESSALVTRLVGCLLLARLIVLERLVIDRKRDHKIPITPKNWLLFQLNPTVENDPDIFSTLF